MLNVTEGFAGTSWLSVKIRATVNGKGLAPFQTLQNSKSIQKSLIDALIVQKNVTDDFSRGFLICHSY